MTGESRSKRIQLAEVPGSGTGPGMSGAGGATDGGAGRVVIRGGRVVDPAASFSEQADLYIEDGAIVGYDRPGSFAGLEQAREIDATGLLVIPGLIDMHVHLREPGYEYKETVRTGCAAAAAGGFAAVACMANTNPVNDNAAVTKYILDQGRVAAGAEVFPIGAVSLGLRGETLAEIGEMQRAGIVAVSDDGQPIADSGLMRRALEYCRMFQMTLIAHEEDPHLAAGGVMNEGAIAHRLGLRGIPAAAEEAMVARDIALAELTGGRLHIAHVSTARAVEHVRQARARGTQVTAEAAPHHLWLDDEAVAEYDTNAKMNPPLRTAEDVAAVRVGLADGTVGVIASDHAPHHRDEKDVEFDAAAMGIVGLETTLPLVLALVRDNHLGLMDAVARLTTGPAAVLGIARGTLATGAVANVTVIDEGRRWTVDSAAFRSKGRNTPFHGWNVIGRAALTMVAGRIVYQESDPRRGVGPMPTATRVVARSAS
jgi:dihydroorotase